MKIAIAGYGADGESNYAYWSKNDNQVVIVDERQPTRTIPVDASTIIGDGAFERLEGFDLVIRSPGLVPHKIVTDGKVWSATNEFFKHCPAPIIGVTGSKGKGTTASLITSILQAAGKNVHLIGNIGVPALDVLPQIATDDIVVYELSSFQLWDIEQSPQVAVVLYIEPDHLDVHADFDDYLRAKSQIVRWQNIDDLVVYNQENTWATTIADQAEAKQIPYQDLESAHVKQDAFWYGEQKICSVDELQLPGVHNQDNACAAIAAVWQWVQEDIGAIAKGLASFTGLAHRLKFVRTYEGVSYYDDSIATTPGSAIAAIKAFVQPKVLILGGSNKGTDYDDLVDEVSRSDSIRAIICVGETGPAIAKALQQKSVTIDVMTEHTPDMTHIVTRAAASAQPGDVVILSPASASFDMFKSYVDRGNQFIEAVNDL